MSLVFVGLIFGLPFVILGLIAGWQHLFQKRWPEVLPYTFHHQLTGKMTLPWGDVFYYDNRATCKSPELTPIVLIHSYGSSLFSWRYQLTGFGDYPLFAFDHPGMGKSDKVADLNYDLDGFTERVLAILDKANIKECYIIGCSMGGLICLWLSSLLPQRFLKTIVISPAVAPNLLPIKKFNYLLITKISQRIPRPLVKMALRKALYNQKMVQQDIFEQYYEPYNDPNAFRCFMKTTDIFRDHRVFTALAQRTSPTLVLWGKNDRVTTLSHMNVVKKQLANAEFHIHPWGGHHLMEDDSLWVNEKIANFLNIDIQKSHH